MIRALFLIAIVVLFCAATTNQLAGQESDLKVDNEAPRVGHADRLESGALDQITAKVVQSIVQISDSTQALILGTVVSSDGLVVSKASELTGVDFQCRFHDGSQAAVKVIGISQAHDLALLEVETNELSSDLIQPIEFPQQSPALKAGSFVLFVGIEHQPPRFGVIGLDGYEFSIDSQECTDCIELGLTCKPVTSVEQGPGANNRPSVMLQVQKVEPRSLSEQARLRVGDEIESINGQKISIALELDQIIRSLSPGDEVVFEIRRAGESKQLKTNVSRFSSHVSHDQWGGGPFNRRRFGFSSVITHDISIAPGQCGSPLVDLRGHVVGINIARSLRVATLAIPLPQVKELILGLRPNAAILTN